MSQVTRKCSNCGWEISNKSDQLYCPKCKTKYTYGPCRRCGKVRTYHKALLCSPCIFADWCAEEKPMLEASRKRWLECINMVPDSYPRLTEAQWLRACASFDGCAMCEEQDVSVRGYFIPFELGGRYCDWNILPLCEECGSTHNFGVHDYMKGTSFSTFNRTKYRQIIEYLGPLLKKAVSGDE